MLNLSELDDSVGFVLPNLTSFTHFILKVVTCILVEMANLH